MTVFDPVQSLRGCTQYFAWLLKRYKKDLKLALAGYNAGEGRSINTIVTLSMSIGTVSICIPIPKMVNHSLLTTPTVIVTRIRTDFTNRPWTG
jgi:hypothetical protein